MKTPKNIQIQARFISKGVIRTLALSLPMILINLYLLQAKAEAQSIVPEPNPNGTGTTVSTPAGQSGTFNIQGGKTSDTNLFHSFREFGLSDKQIANFISNPNILNILVRINGGNPSFINGKIQVSAGSGTPNLFLMNPSGIIFGNNASLDVKGSFTATTATGIGFGKDGSLFFNAVGPNNYTNLTGPPTSFAFGGAQAGAIISTATKLEVNSGQNLTFLGGTVVSTGSLSAPGGGQITLASVRGTNLVRISEPGSVLSLEIKPLGTSSPTSTLPIASLPELLTGGISQFGSATGVSVKNGEVVLTASNQANRVVSAGDVAVTGNLAPQGGAIAIQAANSVAVSANLTTQGRPIEIKAANSLAVTENMTTQGGAITLKANGDIITRALNSSSSTTSGGNITVTSVTGKVETGNINAGSSANKSDSGNVSITARDVKYVGPSSNIQTGFIDATSTGGNGGAVTLNASNDIEVKYINAEGNKDGGKIDIQAGRYFRATGTFTTSANGGGKGGGKPTNYCSSPGCSISAFSTGTGSGGNKGTITISHGGGTKTPFGIGPDYNGLNGTAGSIVIGGNNQVIPFGDPKAENRINIEDSKGQEPLQTPTGSGTTGSGTTGSGTTGSGTTGSGTTGSGTTGSGTTGSGTTGSGTTGSGTTGSGTTACGSTG
ncbi:two-partner secretion domain-containing protein, partial [Microcoleus sp. OTE_8_concoct_300]|uniref:two-partner secretion domain-containing protein n=1 Tax=Microcoleus sp. OTE_8_concoct_300 TaxID=2964710 RepID=UPI00403FBCEB